MSHSEVFKWCFMFTEFKNCCQLLPLLPPSYHRLRRTGFQLLNVLRFMQDIPDQSATVSKDISQFNSWWCPEISVTPLCPAVDRPKDWLRQLETVKIQTPAIALPTPAFIFEAVRCTATGRKGSLTICCFCMSRMEQMVCRKKKSEQFFVSGYKLCFCKIVTLAIKLCIEEGNHNMRLLTPQVKHQQKKRNCKKEI